ncbi:nuclear transport factor 2 family protein [Aquabacterium sp. A7-Y]|uniref:nuclear transport factor 2 family protein n=1 Tax=Aquabacterium sp. A7-Y TaxID=1349605 RepID=UPI00223E0514|nr:nuclear transport factor 2 family protein [Aquabacterium sp. A7-Y]MCW7537021.1 nuclear transport factor 2 family protein [Aquabacterium sp. A7-Y]
MNPSSSDRPARALVAHAFDRFAAGELEPLMTLLADDVVWEVKGSTSWSGVYTGKDALTQQLLSPLFAALSAPLVPRAIRIYADGTAVIVEWKGDALTQAGQPYRNDYCWICEMNGEKIARVSEYLDTALVETVLGDKNPGAAR